MVEYWLALRGSNLFMRVESWRKATVSEEVDRNKSDGEAAEACNVEAMSAIERQDETATRSHQLLECRVLYLRSQNC